MRTHRATPPLREPPLRINLSVNVGPPLLPELDPGLAPEAPHDAPYDLLLLLRGELTGRFGPTGHGGEGLPNGLRDLLNDWTGSLSSSRSSPSRTQYTRAASEEAKTTRSSMFIRASANSRRMSNLAWRSSSVGWGTVGSLDSGASAIRPRKPPSSVG